MNKYILMATVEALPGQDEEFNRWYDEEHLRDVCQVPGFISGRRFESDPASPTASPGRYLAVYELETDDPAAVLAELSRRARSGEMAISPSLAPGTAQMTLYKAR
jgi:hypothetical protein